MNYKLNLKNYSSINEAFESIPIGATSIDLSNNNLGGMTEEQFEPLKNLSLTRPNIRLLNLTHNRLFFLSLVSHHILMSSLVRIFPNFTSLNLSINNLGAMNQEELTTMMYPLRLSRLQELNLSWTGLNRINVDNFGKIMSAMPRSFSHLNLSINCLYQREGNNLEQMMSFVPASVDALSLSKNFLGSKKEAFLHTMKGILPTVKKLDLSYNFIHELQEDDVTEVLDALHFEITFLNLACNGLSGVGLSPLELMKHNYKKLCSNGKGPANLIAILESITKKRPNLSSIDLSENRLNIIPIDILKRVLHAIAKNVSLIMLQRNYLFYRKSQIKRDIFLKELGDINLRQRLDLSDNCESEVARAIVPLTQMSIFGIPKSDQKGAVPISSDNIISIASFLQNNLSPLQTMKSIEKVSRRVSKRLRFEAEEKITDYKRKLRSSSLADSMQSEESCSKIQKTDSACLRL